MYRICIPVCLFCILAACSTHRTLPRQPDTIAADPPAASQVLTVLLKASWQADSTVLFKVDHIVRSAGMLKAYKSRSYDAAFVAYFTDAAGKCLDSCYLNHPLIDRIEHNEAQGQLTTTLIKRGEGSVSARVNNRQDISILLIRPLDAVRKQPEIKLSLL